uniref:Uncharacterized protein n=1 Tax=Kalanchoe fedtschenkoi TaxID=63787 RepID=A0A7N1A1V4_KALFE
MPHPEKEKHPYSAPSPSFGRSILSFGRGQVHSMDSTHDSTFHQDSDLEAFQKLVSDLFNDLSSVESDHLLSLPWLHKLLNAFVSCHDHFAFILSKNKLQLTKPPLDKFTSDYFDRSVKALDICNATRDGIGKIRQWEKQLEIVVSALDPQSKTLSEGQFRRAKKALMELALDMLDDKDTGGSFSHRNRSFGRHNAGSSKDHQHHPPGHSRSLSWSVSRSWSASKQLQSIANCLVPPRGNEIAATNGLAIPIFTMSFVLLFVLWVLVAAIPCQDRSLQIHFTIPRQFPWGNSIVSLHERIMEAGRRGRKNTNWLLKEVNQIEKCSQQMTNIIDSAQFPLSNEQKLETGQGVGELALACESLKNGLSALERQVRDIFRKVMSCRTEGLDMLDKPNNL